MQADVYALGVQRLNMLNNGATEAQANATVNSYAQGVAIGSAATVATAGGAFAVTAAPITTTELTAAAGGLVPGTEGVVLTGATAVAAANAAADAAGAVRGAAAGLVTKAGEVFTGLSTRAGGPGQATNAVVQGALDAVPAAERSAFHGACCEINAISNALNAGADVRGATAAAVNAGGPNGGAIKLPCSSCAPVLRQFEIEHVEP